MRTTILLAGLLSFLALASPRPVAAEGEGCRRWDMEVVCSTAQTRILVGDPLVATARVTNTGDSPLKNVTLALRGRAGTRQVGAEPLVVTLESLAAGEVQEIHATFVADAVGEARFDASARDENGWAAAGCLCSVAVEGLPALQLEMIDLNADREPDGVFEEGQDFLYVLEVENDMGTAVTPDLHVVWSLPPSLAFVSGAGDRGVTVTGADQKAESSVFVLAPNEKQRLELVVRVIGVPPERLVQARASVQTPGGQELAEESESTTLRPRSGR